MVLQMAINRLMNNLHVLIHRRESVLRCVFLRANLLLSKESGS
jgi:hypothetical protein